MDYSKFSKLLLHNERNTLLDSQIIKDFQLDNYLSDNELKTALNTDQYTQYKRDWLLDYSIVQLETVSL